LRPRIERAIKAMTKRLNEIEGPLDESNLFASPSYWQVAAIRDGMIKVHMSIEQNFRYIETFGVLAITRYIFELLIWFRLLASGNTEHAFSYARQLMTDNCRCASEELAKLKGEIELFRQLQAREHEELGEAAKAAIETAGRPEQFGAASRMIAQEIDRTARRCFCVYADGAKTAGYGPQADLLETKFVPELERRVKQTQEWKDKAIAQMPKSMPKDWKWDKMAKAAGMSEQYDFLYRYTSRLLHAKPISFYKGQKNLEVSEVNMFLDFVFVSILEMSEISERLAGLSNPQAN